MFEGEKTWVFWVGLIIFAFAFIETFSLIWNVATIPAFMEQTLRAMIPFVVGGIVFIIVGLYMMKSGVKKKESS